jgi:toxin ParE1/3/4
LARFDLTETARADLQAIVDYTVARWGAAQARRYVDALEAQLAHLAEQPPLGRMREELSEGVRSFPFESHVIYYSPVTGGVLVARVLHRRQDPHRHIG